MAPGTLQRAEGTRRAFLLPHWGLAVSKLVQGKGLH